DFPAHENLGAFCLRVMELHLDPLDGEVASDRRNVGARVSRVAHRELLRPLHEGPEKPLIDGLLDENPFERRTGLPGIVELRLHQVVERKVEVGAGKDDEGVLSWPFEDHLLARLTKRLLVRQDIGIESENNDDGNFRGLQRLFEKSGSWAPVKRYRITENRLVDALRQGHHTRRF